MPTLAPLPPTYAAVDLSALTHNLAALRRVLRPGCNIMAVVKANAYGHGAVDVARCLIRQGVTRLAVVSVEEGRALRTADIRTPIVVLGPLFPDQIPDLFAYQLTPVISDMGIVPALVQHATTGPAPYPIHIKVETGMGRLGLAQEEAITLLTSGTLSSRLTVEGLMTHFADADGDTAELTSRQLARFSSVLATLEDKGLSIPLIHASNSGAAVRYPDAQFSLIRPGIMLYGYHTLPAHVEPPALRPVLSLHTQVAQLRTVPVGGTVSYNGTFIAARPTRVAILPIGYADGYSRRLSNRGEVLVRGRRARVIGIVCMDMIMVDVTDIPGVAVGDDVVLIGRQEAEAISAADVAEWTGTIAYEVLCAIGPRVPRVYQRETPEPSR